jgi:hypothetical protein
LSYFISAPGTAAGVAGKPFPLQFIRRAARGEQLRREDRRRAQSRADDAAHANRDAARDGRAQ